MDQIRIREYEDISLICVKTNEKATGFVVLRSCHRGIDGIQRRREAVAVTNDQSKSVIVDLLAKIHPFLEFLSRHQRVRLFQKEADIGLRINLKILLA